MSGVPVLEIGGSHATAALVSGGTVLRRTRSGIEPNAPADILLDVVAAVASALGGPSGAEWAAAVPGPFDYGSGIARFAGVGKFDSLNGVDVGAALRERIVPAAAGIHFLNDAIAFGLGESAYGQGRDRSRIAAITLGTGVGSAFIADGQPVTEGRSVPPEGRVDLLTIDGRPLEETVSTRALGSTLRAAAHDWDAARAARGAFTALGRALNPWLRRFDASMLVVGGGMTAAWDLIAPPLTAALPPDVSLARSADTETSALLGAALSRHPRS